MLFDSNFKLPFGFAYVYGGALIAGQLTKYTTFLISRDQIFRLTKQRAEGCKIVNCELKFVLAMYAAQLGGVLTKY